jgi:hypothetical protein
MKPRVWLYAAAFSVLLISCGKSPEPAAVQQTAAPESAAPPAAAAPESAAPAAAPARQSRPGDSAPAKKQAAAPAAAPARTAAPPRARSYTLPAGAIVKVRTTSALSTKTAETGQAFTASLEEPLMVDETVIAPKGALVEGRVTESDPGGRVSGRAQIALRLSSVQLPGGSVDIVTSTVSREAASTAKKDATKVGIGAGIGAAVGAIAGGGKGAGIGAAAGAGAGTGAVLATRGDAAAIPAETVLTFKLQSAVTVTK